MAYYLLFNFDVHDQEKYNEYSRAVPQAAQPGMKALVFDNARNDLEGESRATIFILEFESEEAAMRWYNSPEYKAITHLREESTEGWLRGVPQLMMPAS